MNSIVTVFRLVVLPLVIAVLGLVAIAVAPSRPTAAGDRGVYDSTDLARVDYSGLRAPVAITARDGARLAVRVYDAPGNTVVLAIHGSSGNGRYYHPLAQFLSGKGKATVYTLDLRGHGASDGRRGDVDYVGQLEDDVADVNTLNAISALIPEDPGRAERLVEQLAVLLRFSLDSGERHTVSVAAEVAIVRAYLEIEEARLGDRLRCGIDVPDALTSCDVPALALHTLVQNSVKHVAAARVEPTEVRVRVEARAGRLHLFVWDGGDKFDLDAIPAGHGLDMLRTRLEVLYGGAGRLAVQGAAGGKEVSISLPLRRPE